MSGAPTRTDLSMAIRLETAQWIADGRVPDVRAIGCGPCGEFAEAVMERLGCDGYGSGRLPEDSHGRLIDCESADWWVRVLKADGTDAGEAECFVADVARLRREGAPLPDGLTDDDAEFASFLGSLTHNWLVLDGLHHDATCPDGAEHWLLMPFFAGQIACFLAERAAMGATA